MVENLFNLLSIFYAFRGLQIAGQVVRSWDRLKGDAFPPQYKSLAEQASFFLAVPVSVLFHEGAHALAVIAFGGRVEEFGYRVFWGFVVPSGRFSDGQYWLVALAGTLGSLIFGVLLWIGLGRLQSPTFRYFGLRALRYQIQFSLIYYPLFTLMGFYGDWRTIYDFGATPLLSGLTAAGHVALLAMAFWAERSGFFQMASFRSPGQRAEFDELESQAVQNPDDLALQLKLIEQYRRRGMSNQANRRLQALLKRYPDSAEGHLQRAILQSEGQRRIPKGARDSAEKALSLGLSRPSAVALAEQIIGQYQLAIGRVDEAISRFERALGAARGSADPAQMGQLTYLRALAHRRKGRYEMAYQDILSAIKLAEEEGNERTLALYRQELETIQHHTGRSYPT